jgi:hypothetical protein
MKEKPSIFEWVAFWVFVVLEIVLFVMRIMRPTIEINQTENVLYSTFEIVFSLYIGYFIQRIDTMRQFQERLKQYGFSAYRRIMDIRKSIDRSLTAIDQMNKNYPKDKTNDMDILRSMLEGTSDTVESSVLDWSDIIGEEINKKAKADQLEEVLKISETRSILGEETQINLAEIRMELEKLKSEIPAVLQTNYSGQEETMSYKRDLEYTMLREQFITLDVQHDIDFRYSSDTEPFSDAEKPKIISGEPYLLKRGYRRYSPVVDVYGKDKQKVGIVTHVIGPVAGVSLLNALMDSFVPRDVSFISLMMIRLDLQ